jgi:hypothetical protein
MERKLKAVINKAEYLKGGRRRKENFITDIFSKL